LDFNQKNSSKFYFGVTSVIPAKAGIQILKPIRQAQGVQVQDDNCFSDTSQLCCGVVHFNIIELVSDLEIRI